MGLASQADVNRHAKRSARDLANLAPYRAFNHWKSACILQGVYARYREGEKSAEGVDLAHMASQILT